MKFSSRRKRIGIVLVGLLSGAVLGVTFVGPWPTYGNVDLEEADYFQQAIAAIAASAARSERTATPGPLAAGWAKMPMTLPSGTPLAGYGNRRGQPATGAHDELTVKALVLSDGRDRVAIVASDLLIVPENVAEKVRIEVARRVALAADDILFSASHTHSGPGAFAPGWVAGRFAGEYDPAVVTALAELMAETIVRAYESQGPARLGRGRVKVPEHIRNRTREGAPVDPDLDFLLVEKHDRSRCTMVSFAAHPTLVGGDNMEWSAGYPGALTRTLEREVGGMALFLAGAMGSMGPEPPAGLAGFAAAEALGRSLASRVVAELDGLALDDRLDVASVGIALKMPPLQVRWNRWLRLSPFLVRGLGVDNRAWLQGVRVGETVLIGTPSDFSGELSVELKTWAAELGYDLWVLSFNGDYIGYVSPDRYYATASRKGREGYEMVVMSWCGPQQAEYLVRLVRRMVGELEGG
ncbi:MAG: hypothetical protein GY856_54280 [bacterium]|nr:hypothetical protein [bacterium]